MREFRYNALTSNGNTVTGIRRAESVENLASVLAEQGLILLKTKSGFDSLRSFFSGTTRTSKKELREFTQHMSTSLSAGITAVSALADFECEKNSGFAHVISDIRSDVSSGTQIDESFSRHASVFPPVYLALVAAGQSSGRLDEAFDELVAYLEWSEDLREQTSQAMIYPTILSVGIIGLFLLMMLFVIPRFGALFSDSGAELPTLTVRVLAMGNFLGHWWWLLGSVAAGIYIAAKMYVRTEKGELQRDWLLLNIPVVGTFVHKLALSRFAKTFSLIFASGLSLLHVLDLLQEIVGNKVMSNELAVIRSRVATGETLTESFAGAPIFPTLIQRLVSVGEKTGSLDTSLMRASDHLNKEIPRDLKKAFTVFEALVIALLGVMVCVAALALLMPIMQIRGKMG